MKRNYKFLEDNINHGGPDCLIVPFYRNPNGYAMLSHKGKMRWAHRLMCEMAHGPAPYGHEAAHSCGNGKLGCVHPMHLSWKTKSENSFDRRRHGTSTTNKWGSRGKIRPEHAAQIRALAGRMTQTAIAQRFGISAPTVRDILKRRTHSGGTKQSSC